MRLISTATLAPKILWEAPQAKPSREAHCVGRLGGQGRFIHWPTA